MSDRDNVLTAVFHAVDRLNDQLPSEKQLAKSLETHLYGEVAALDSLGLVNLIVAVEQEVAESLGRDVTLADERAMSQKRSPFRTIGSLVQYVESLLYGAVT